MAGPLWLLVVVVVDIVALGNVDHNGRHNQRYRIVGFGRLMELVVGDMRFHKMSWALDCNSDQLVDDTLHDHD